MSSFGVVKIVAQIKDQCAPGLQLSEPAVHVHAVGLATHLAQLHGAIASFALDLEGVELLAPADVQETLVGPAEAFEGCDALFFGEVNHGWFLLWCCC